MAGTHLLIAAALALSSLLFTVGITLADDPQSDDPAAPIDAESGLLGHLLAGRAGHFAYYRFDYQGDQSVATVSLQIAPDDGEVLRNAGFRVYGPKGALVVTGGAQLGLTPNVSANVISGIRGPYLVQVYNVDPTVAIDFELDLVLSAPRAPAPPPTSLAAVPPPTASPAAQPQGIALGQRAKSEGCVPIDGRPDPDCTPGAADPRVTQATIGETICVSGYTKTVRPRVSVTNEIKRRVFLQYGIAEPPSSAFELDHFIPLQLGGYPGPQRAADIDTDPNTYTNLWPEAAAPKPGFREKDVVETALKRAVCAGRMTLAEAQRLLVADWHLAATVVKPKPGGP